MASQGAATAQGAAAGAGTGAMVGSAVPVIGTAIGAGAGAIIGGLAGYFGSSSGGDETGGLNLSDLNPLGRYGGDTAYASLSDLNTFVGAGPGLQDVSDAYGAQRDLSNTLNNYAAGGYMPDSSDINQSNVFAQSMFAPLQQSLNTNFYNQNIQANRQAALMGRSGNDPILAAKLGTVQTQMQGQLDAQRNAFSTQFAQNMPMQRLNFMGQRADVMSGLASQAMANRQALMSMGSQTLAQQQNYQIGTASHWGNWNQNQGGGAGGAIQGVIAGAGAGMSAYSKFAGGGGSYGGGYGGNGYGGGGSAPAGNPFGYGSYHDNPGISGGFAGASSGPTLSGGSQW